MSPEIHGVEVDAEGRCDHYRGRSDTLALRLPCCERFYACHACHESLAGHEATRWPPTEFARRALLCGRCGSRLSIEEYLAAPGRCPGCGGAFNPRCVLHHPLYFEL